MRRNPMVGRLPMIGCSLNLLGDVNLEQIHLATLEVLEDVGVRIDCEEALDIFRQAGARVEDDTKIVHIPAYIVEGAVKTAPHQFTVGGRDPKNDVIIGGDRVSFIPFGEGVTVEDPYTGEIRESTKEDAAKIARLTDAFDSFSYSFDTVIARDVAPETLPLHTLDAQANNTTKCLWTSPEGKRSAEYLVEMGRVIAGGDEQLKAKPVIMGGGCPISPLTLCKEYTEALIVYARAKVPFLELSMALSGGTAPTTLAGTLVTHNAEVLSSVVLSQLVQPGAPVIYGSSTTNLDLRKGTATVGSPELALINACVAQLAQFYGLPSFVAGG